MLPSKIHIRSLFCSLPSPLRVSLWYIWWFGPFSAGYRQLSAWSQLWRSCQSFSRLDQKFISCYHAVVSPSQGGNNDLKAIRHCDYQWPLRLLVAERTAAVLNIYQLPPCSGISSDIGSSWPWFFSLAAAAKRTPPRRRRSSSRCEGVCRQQCEMRGFSSENLFSQTESSANCDLKFKAPWLVSCLTKPAVIFGVCLRLRT